MTDKDLRVNLRADDDITPAAKKAKAALDSIPDKVETTVDVDSSGIDELTGKLGELPGLLGTLGSAGAAGGVGALAVGMFAAADAAAEMAISAQTTADLTGSTVEESSKLQNLWGRTGADVNDLNDVLLQMNGALAQAPELAKKLGINLRDGKNIQERFVEVTQMLADGQLTAVEASQLFGEEGVRQVGKLRTMYGGLADDLERMPAPVDDDDVDAAIEMKNAVADLKNVLSTTVGIVGKELVPLFGDLATLANEAADAMPGGKEGGGAELLEFIRGWGTGIGILAKGAAAAGDALGPNLTAGLDESVDNLKNYQEQLAAAAEGTDKLSDATKENMATVFSQIAAIRDANDARDEAIAGVFSEIAAVRDLMAVMQENADMRRGLADSEFAYRDAQRDFVKALEETAAALEENGPATLEGAASLDEFAQSAGGAADAAVRLEADQMAARGATQSATQAQQTWNGAMITSARTTSGPMQQAIVNYIATVNGIPPEKVSEILANPDYATIDAAKAALDKAAADQTAEIVAHAQTAQAEADLARLERNRQMTIYARMVAAGGGTGAGVGPSPAMVPMVAGPTATATTVAVPAPAAAALPPITIKVPVPTPSITIQTGIMGNRFDSQRVLTKALRAHQRLNGLRE